MPTGAKQKQAALQPSVQVNPGRPSRPPRATSTSSVNGSEGYHERTALAAFMAARMPRAYGLLCTTKLPDVPASEDSRSVAPPERRWRGGHGRNALTWHV